jgi:hypothetical protein
MKKINVYVNSVVRWAAYKKESEYQAWIDYAVANNLWGQPGTYTVEVVDATAELEQKRQQAEGTKKQDFDAHANSTSNPHSVTKEQVGLGSVDNIAAADLRDRSTHTGSQLSSTISDFTSAVQAVTIDASKIGDGSVSNAEFATLDGIVTGVSVQSQIDTKEPEILSGLTTEYWRGDKSFQTLNAAAVANTPSGSISSTTVQAAIDELNTEKQPTGNYITALTGDVTASGPGSASATLANSGVVAGTYSLVTVDAKGRVTEGSNSGSITRYSYFSTAAVASTSVTYASVAELTTVSLPVGLYAFRFHGNMQSAATNNGVGVRVAPVTATMTTVSTKWNIPQGANGTAHDFEYDQTANNTNIASASAVAANTNFSVNGFGVFRITVAGTVAIQIRTETAGTAATLQLDSAFILELV